MPVSLEVVGNRDDVPPELSAIYPTTRKRLSTGIHIDPRRRALSKLSLRSTRLREGAIRLAFREL
jgi:hypothetical protein